MPARAILNCKGLTNRDEFNFQSLGYFTLSVTVADCCILPLVAVTVRV